MALSQLFTGIVGVVAAFTLLALLVLAILMPYYVYKIAQHVRETDEQIKKTNTLLRQLLISYGQDPQA